MRYIDFHTHILPEMDDGAQTVEEAIEMLKTAYESGAQTVILTPHYQSQIPIADFLKRRAEKLRDLKQAMKKDGGNFPKLLLGAEVMLDCVLSEEEDLDKLCIEGTNLLLIELPYSNWNKWHVDEVYHIIAKRNITPVIAHVERYVKKIKDIEKLDPYISVGANFQINAESFLKLKGKRVIRALAAEGLICAIASDCHDNKGRNANMKKALSELARKFGDPFIEFMYKKTEKLLKDHTL